MQIYGLLSKVEEQDDGTIKVFGIASTGARDDQGEIILPSAMKAAIPDYSLYPTIREMHQPSAAGTALELSVDDDGVTHIIAHVVDPLAVQKVKAKVYRGFSIGGQVLARDPNDRTIVTEIALREISLVDRPANPEAAITMYKFEDVGGAKPAPSSAAATLEAALRRSSQPSQPATPETVLSPEDALQKAARAGDLPAVVAGLQKAFDAREAALLRLIEAQGEQIAKLMAQPLPPATARSGLATVEKSVDSAGIANAPPPPSADQIARALAALSEAERTQVLMRAALANPIPISA